MGRWRGMRHDRTPTDIDVAVLDVLGRKAVLGEKANQQTLCFLLSAADHGWQVYLYLTLVRIKVIVLGLIC